MEFILLFWGCFLFLESIRICNKNEPKCYYSDRINDPSHFKGCLICQKARRKSNEK